ncbi:hypothetical protein J6590_075497 [Homalodisca vitripennis]|nr:hypothetical protein J6590_075497 [Homalodisca vitripennis]
MEGRATQGRSTSSVSASRGSTDVHSCGWRHCCHSTKQLLASGWDTWFKEFYLSIGTAQDILNIGADITLHCTPALSSVWVTSYTLYILELPRWAVVDASFGQTGHVISPPMREQSPHWTTELMPSNRFIDFNSGMYRTILNDTKEYYSK